VSLSEFGNVQLNSLRRLYAEMVEPRSSPCPGSAFLIAFLLRQQSSLSSSELEYSDPFRLSVVNPHLVAEDSWNPLIRLTTRAGPMAGTVVYGVGMQV
jgi:hypothetical protein